MDRRVALVTAIATLCTCGAAGAALGVVYERSPGDAHDVPALTQPAADTPASTVVEPTDLALVPTAPLVIVPDGATPTPTLPAVTSPTAGRPSAPATTPGRPPAAISGAPVAGTVAPEAPEAPVTAPVTSPPTPTTAPATVPTTVARGGTTPTPTATSTPSAPATTTATTVPTAPATSAAPTTTVRPPGVPKDWPANKPIPPMPPNCGQPQLEDNGVWNCQ